MRTSRISRDTAKYASVVLRGKDASRRRFASSLADFSAGARRWGSALEDDVEDSGLSSAPSSPLSSVPSSPELGGTVLKNEHENDEASQLVKAEGVPSRKRKRASTAVREGELAAVDPPIEVGLEKIPVRRTKALASTKKRLHNGNGGEVKIHPPPRWEELYAIVKEMRTRITAPVDTDGCERLADPASSPKDRRFQTLVSLMLSSQTKDAVTAAAIRSLHATLPGGLSLSSISILSVSELDARIAKVGFHTTKAKNILATCTILEEKFDGDIPDTPEGLMSLPGVGPKMAYLCMTAAWGRVEGIGVDTHVHRLANMWKWTGPKGTKGPEDTRRWLEAWVPRPLWGEINAVLVGFGQSVCLPVGRKCGVCDVGRKGGRTLCPGYIKPKGVKKEEVEAEVKQEVTVGDMEDLGISAVATRTATTRRRTTRGVKIEEAVVS